MADRRAARPNPEQAIAETAATSTLLSHVGSLPDDMLADLRIHNLEVTRFAYTAAPHRVDLEPDLANKLLLD